METIVQPELKQVLGALLFGAKGPLPLKELRRVLAQTAETVGDYTRPFGEATEADLRAALEQLNADLAARRLGLHVAEVAGGFRLQTDMVCGPWLRELLDLRKPNRLSRPALETLAIIAYRQPIARAEIEAVRGVNVDAMMRGLLEMQLIAMVGRSDLPGRPMLYGTTQLFLEHFGLKTITELPGIEQLCRREEERARAAAAAAPEASAATEGDTPTEGPAAAPPQPELFAAEAAPADPAPDATPA